MVEKYGFVYIWRDRKHKRYYVGCHWGREDDGYICSSNWMRKSFRRRPYDFKRRIIKTNIASRQETLKTEQYYFNMIKPEELRYRYYNISLDNFNLHIKSDIELKFIAEKKSKSNKGRICSEETRQKISKSNKIKFNSPEMKHRMSELNSGKNNPRFGKILSDEHKQALFNANRGRKCKEETKQKLRDANLGKTLSDEHKTKISESHKGKGKVHSNDTKLIIQEQLKGLYYWNNGIINIRSKICPGDEWIRGMKPKS